MSLDDQDNLDLPAELQKQLRDRFGKAPHVPVETDRLIAGMARAHLAKRRRLRLFAQSAAAGAAVAAVIAVAAVLFRADRPAPAQSAARGDINGDGRIDMLDAYVLARSIHDQSPAQQRWDIDHDGVVNQRDVDSLASIAVSLGKAAPQ